MEGKEYQNEDDERKSGSQGNKDESDDFGLPDASFDSESEESSDSSEEEPASNIYSTEPESDYSSEVEEENTYQSVHYTSDDDEGRRTPTGLIVFLSLIGVIVIAIAVYWFFFRTPEEEPVQEPVVEAVVDTTAVEPVIEEPEPEPEPVEIVEEEPTVLDEGSITTITDRTGRYYIVLNSFFDDDLAKDYADKMAASGVSTVILGTQDKKGFERVALSEDFGSWGAAESRMNELKATYGSEIWVLKY